MAIPLRDLADQINDIALLDVMDALGTPVRDDVPPQSVRQRSRGTDLGEALSNEGLDQILDLIDHQSAPGLLPLFSWIPPIQSGGEDPFGVTLTPKPGNALSQYTASFSETTNPSIADLVIWMRGMMIPPFFSCYLGGI